MSSLFCLFALRMKYHIDLRAIPILVFLSLGLTLFQTFLLLHFVKKKFFESEDRNNSHKSGHKLTKIVTH